MFVTIISFFLTVTFHKVV